MTDILEQVAKPENVNGDIPQAVAEMPQEIEAPEAKPYVISFVRYNEKMCEIGTLDSNKAKRAIQTLKTVGMKIHSKDDYKRNSLDAIPVRCEGEYKKLFNGLPEEVELKEIKLQWTL